MNIDPGSWHYRLLLSWNSYKVYKVPTNLCPYIRQLAAALFIFSSVGLGVLSLVGSTLAAWTALAMGWDLSEDSPYHAIYMIGGSVSAVIAIVLLWAALYWSVQGIKFAYRKARNAVSSDTGPVEPSEPSLVVEYLKAKHDKVCPQLTFKRKSVRTNKPANKRKG